MNLEDITADEHYVICTDGACSGNPGPGGWGAVLYRMKGTEVLAGPRELSAGAAETTNNEMELTAALRGLSKLAPNGLPAIVYTDSRYVIGGMTEWHHDWIKREWWKRDGTPVINAELWKAILAAVGERQVHWEWVKGHSGHAGNELADGLAKAATAKAKRKARQRT